MPGALNLNLKQGERDIYQCQKLKTLAKAKKRIRDYNMTHKAQIHFRVIGCGLEVWR